MISGVVEGRIQRAEQRAGAGGAAPEQARGVLVELLLLAPGLDAAQLLAAALDQLAHRGDAHLLRLPRRLGALQALRGEQRHALLHVDRLAEPRDEALVALHDVDAAAAAELAAPALLVVAAIGLQLLGLALRVAVLDLQAPGLGHRGVALAFGVGEQGQQRHRSWAVMARAPGGFHELGSVDQHAAQALHAVGERGRDVHVLLQQCVHRGVQLYRGVEVGVVAGRIGAELDQVARLGVLRVQLAKAPRRFDVRRAATTLFITRETERSMSIAG